MKILIIEDDSKIVKSVGYTFITVWPDIEIISSGWGKEGVELVETQAPDIVILDIGLPDIDGLDVVKQIRLFSQIPILILTADVSETMVVQALELGANDYVTKPFRQMELIARVKNLLKFYKRASGEDKLFWGSLIYDYDRREINRNNVTINLTGTENEILRALINNSPNIVPLNTLSEIVWGDYYEGAINSLKVHINHLRKKIEIDPENPQIIFSKSGLGYYAIKPLS